MNLHIPLSPEAEARLREQAAAAGRDVEAYVLYVVENSLASQSAGPQNHESNLDAEEAFRRGLAAHGLLCDATLPQGGTQDFANWTPVVIAGKPLSETIIEDRG